MTSPRILLLLGPDHLSAYLISRHRFQHLAELEEDSLLSAFLGNWNVARFHVLVDLAEEHFQAEPLPRLPRADRQALLARRLEQTFRHTPYRQALVPGPGRMLLCALSARERLDRLLDALLKARCPIAGIHSVALGSAQLLRREVRAHPPWLLLQHCRPGTLRQTLFDQHGPRFSRLLPAPTDGLALAEELSRTWHYLLGNRLLSNESPLQVLWLDSSAPDPCLLHACQARLPQLAPPLTLQPQAVPALARRLKLPETGTDWLSCLGLAIARRRIGNHYCPPPARRFHRLYQLKRGLLGATLLGALAGATLGLHGWSASAELLRRNQQATQQLQQLHEQQRLLQLRLQRLGTAEPARVRAVVELYQQQIVDWPDVHATARALSRDFAAAPLLQLERLTWHALSSPPAPEAAPLPPEREPLAQRPRWQWIELSGQVASPLASPQQVTAQLEQLTQRLRQRPHTRVEIRQRPFETLQQHDPSQGSAFLLRIHMGPGI